MNIRLPFTIAVSKLTIKLCRLFRSGGTTLPGKIALKLYPEIIKKITRDFKIIMVTGTNGKTTTSRIIGQILKMNGIDHITNKSGANLVSGVVTTFLSEVGLMGNCQKHTALIEIDEAAFNSMCDYVTPDVLVVTNFFRDQLDRYGELYTTLKSVRSGITKAPGAKLILNADDSLCASLGNGSINDVFYYGISDDAYKGSIDQLNSDGIFCLYCKTKYIYENHIYGHLGSFKCPGCGYSKPVTGITCTLVEELTSVNSKINFSITSVQIPDGSTEYNNDAHLEEQSRLSEYSSVKINLPGLYNIYNSLAAVGCAHQLNLPAELTIKALESFECGFGRMEQINVDGKIMQVILVKNPTGFNQVLNFLLTEEQNMLIAFLINDRLADGTDISWLWDVDFEKLESIQSRIDNIFTSGIRAEDMAVRLKYAGIYTNKLDIIKDYKSLIDLGLSKTSYGQTFYILPTYTAMLDIRKVLKKKYRLREFWE